ncbi:MAG: hypothetical protein QJR05_02330 [Thermoanaerobacterium sp.]|nr:hypothetical protein [Thermoanaerobacterium sp.]
MYLCFTLIFKRNDGYQESFQLIYEPCPCWKKGDRCIINFNKSPHYQKGSFKEFINHIKSTDFEKQCILITDKNWVKNSGYDDNNTLNRIIEDIETEGFKVVVVQF